MPILISHNLDPYHNLAVESCLLDGVGPAPPVLYLWQSGKAVIIGKNQNPWRECSLAYMAEQDIPLCRRESGGGAVYHDQGNVNFCMVVDRKSYREQAQFDVILEALTGLGLEARREGQSSLFTGDRKISGNAYCFRRNLVMHHGTLLVDTDLVPLRKSLNPPPVAMETHAIASVPAPVVNLAALRPGLTLDHVRDALVQTWTAAHPHASERLDPDDFAPADLSDRRNMLAGLDWVLDTTPRFTLHLEAAGVTATLEVQKGRVRSVACRGRNLPGTDRDWLEAHLCGYAVGRACTGALPPPGICQAVMQAVGELVYRVR